MTRPDVDPAPLATALVRGQAAQWTELDPDTAPASIDRVVVTGATVFAEYTTAGGLRRHAVAEVAGDAILAWRDHGDIATRTSSVRSDPVVPAAHSGALAVTTAEDERVAAMIVDFFDVHEAKGIDGVLAAWAQHAHPDVVLWHSAEGVRGRGIEQVLAFYTRQHEKYPYAGFDYDLKVLAARTGYAAGEIEYLLDDPAGGEPIRLPSTFALDLDADARIVSWRDYSRFWIPE